MSIRTRKPTTCNSDCTADQRLSFSYIDRTISFLVKIRNLKLLGQHRPVCVGPGGKSEDKFSPVAAQILSVRHGDDPEVSCTL